MGLAEKLLAEHKEDICELKLVPTGGGVYEVTLGDEVIYSKNKQRRHPLKDEIETAIRGKLRDKRY